MIPKTITRVFLGALISLISVCTLAANPIIPNKGVNDPHVRIFNNKAYLYATHDKSADNTSFIMEDWWVWSSDDLVNWKLESTLQPKNTYVGPNFKHAWATDAATRNGMYYWYFSEKNERTGVVVSKSPTGPWKDVLKKPMMDKDLTPTHEYDMGLIEDRGNHYIIFGVWDYYIAKLNEDMVSLAEPPRKITIRNPRGPYGKGKTDDKPFLHQHNGIFYLSWGAFYATSDNVYGPYEYRGTILNHDSFAPGYAEPTWPNGFLQGRHGSYFQWHNQWYYAYCDISQTGNRYFRDTFISYVHYKADGSIAPLRVDGIGVGEYDAAQGRIEAEDYFKLDNLVKREHDNNKFSLRANSQANAAVYPNIRNTKKRRTLTFSAASSEPGESTLVVRRGGPRGKILLSRNFITQKANSFETFTAKFSKLKAKESLHLRLIPKTVSSVDLDYFVISE